MNLSDQTNGEGRLGLLAATFSGVKVPESRGGRSRSRPRDRSERLRGGGGGVPRRGGAEGLPGSGKGAEGAGREEGGRKVEEGRRGGMNGLLRPWTGGDEPHASI